MIESIKLTSVYKSLNLNKNLSHAYLFYSNDKDLNNNVALFFAKSITCEFKTGCGKCNFCNQFNSNSNPDLKIIEQDSIKVEDANKIISDIATKPISNKHKVFVILNAENANESAQNKLLKSLEEPNDSTVFILSCTKLDKLLPTVLSRLTKIQVPKMSVEDKILISEELKLKNIDITKYESKNYSLSEMIQFETNENYKKTLFQIQQTFTNLKSSADIPKVANELSSVDKTLFFPLLQEVFLDCLRGTKKFDASIKAPIAISLPEKAIIKCIALVEDSHKKQMANVNFNYLLDNLLFNILKEKFLCK